MNGFFRKNAVIGIAEIVGRIPLVFAAGYVARSLGPDVYGNWALAVTFAGLLISVVSLGLPVSLSRIASVDTPERARGYLYLALRFAALAMVPVALLTLATLPWLADAIGIGRDLKWLLLLGCAIAVVNGVEALLDAYFKSRELVARQSLFVVTRSCIEVASILLVFSGTISVGGLRGTKLLVVYVAFATALKLVAYPLLVGVRAPRPEAAPRPDRTTFLRYGIPMIPAGLVVFLTAQGDRLVLGHLFEKDQLGVYAFGASIAAYMVYLGYAINPLLLPRASALHDAGDLVGVQRLFAQSQRVYLVLYALVLSTLVFLSKEVIDLTAGSDFLGGQVVLVLLGAAVGLEALLGIFQWVFHLVRRPSYVLWFNVGYMALNISAVLVAAALGGPAAVAGTVLGTVLVANLVRYRLTRRLLPIRLEPTTVVGVVSLAGLIAFWLAVARDWQLEWRALAALAVAALCAVAGVGVVRDLAAGLPPPDDTGRTRRGLVRLAAWSARRS